MKTGWIMALGLGALIFTAVGQARAELVLEAGSGPATIAVNDFGPTLGLIPVADRHVYGTNSDGFGIQAGQTSAAAAAVLVYNADGSTSLYSDSQVPAYEGADDTIVAVLNHSGRVLDSIVVNGRGSDIFGFDGDGPDARPVGDGYTTYVSPVANPTGYEGPGTYFSSNPNAGQATITFVGGLAVGSSAWFATEEGPITVVNVLGGNGVITPVGGPAVPEPSALVLGSIGIAALLGYARRGRASKP